MRTIARAAAVVGATALLVLGSGFAAAPRASAHPLGNFTINRYSGILLSPGGVRVDYVVDMAEIPTFQERPRIDADGDGAETDAERQAYAQEEGARLLRGVELHVGGSPAALRLAAVSMRYLPGQAGLPTLRLEAILTATAPRAGVAQYWDRNFSGRIGWKEITVGSEAGVAVTRSSAPATSVSRELTAYPKDLLSSPLDTTTATFSFEPGVAATRSEPASSGGTVSTVPIAGGGAFAALIGWRLTPWVLVVSLLLAFLFGAVHALGPGHGKTITAAYLVGSGARVGQAIVVGACVALMHTASVLGLGLVFLVLAKSLPADRVYPWLTTAMGLVALCLGVGLFVARVRAGRRREDHRDPHGHSHGDAEHAHPTTARGLAALAVAGGILPSPTAFVVLAGSIAAHRLGYGLGLIGAFSVGLAGALMGIGLLALRARELVAVRLRGRVALALPLLSAILIVAFGAFFSVRGLTQLS